DARPEPRDRGRAGVLRHRSDGDRLARPLREVPGGGPHRVAGALRLRLPAHARFRLCLAHRRPEAEVRAAGAARATPGRARRNRGVGEPAAHRLPHPRCAQWAQADRSHDDAGGGGPGHARDAVRDAGGAAPAPGGGSM
ncbi:MAG: FIG002571: 4-hydroxybenzoyl-CoA thioesterase domain protein, partial [uncultured Ramlibacter sp.]